MTEALQIYEFPQNVFKEMLSVDDRQIDCPPPVNPLISYVAKNFSDVQQWSVTPSRSPTAFAALAETMIDLDVPTLTLSQTSFVK